MTPFLWRQYSMWRSQFLCSARHNKDTETPDGPEEDRIRHALFRLNVWARVCRIFTVVKSEKKKQETSMNRTSNFGESNITKSQLNHCQANPSIMWHDSTPLLPTWTLTSFILLLSFMWQCNSFKEIHIRNVLIIPVHYLVKFLLIFLILEMRFKCLLLCCKFLHSILETKENVIKLVSHKLNHPSQCLYSHSVIGITNKWP